MKERADGFEADLTALKAELETSKALNASLQQQLSALTIRAEALETQSLATRPSAPVVQPENVDVVSVATNFGAWTKESLDWSRGPNLSAQNGKGVT